jgi:ATP-dependent exoDNAse (exonuclease V) beta subunit
MKYRILLQLHDLAFKNNSAQDDPMGEVLLETLEITPQELQQRAKRSLKTILHHYAAFDVITLDGFTHRIIRTFAKDLGLSYNFDVTLEVDEFLEEIVDRVLDRVGEAPDLTGILEQFTFEKMDDEGTSSWELKKNLIDAAKLLLNENDRTQIQRIALLSLSERKTQQEFLQYKYKSLVVELTNIGEMTLNLFKEHELEASHFNRKTLYNRFLKLSKGTFSGFDDGQLYQNMKEGRPLYPKKVDVEIQQCIDRLSVQIIGNFEKALNLFFQWQLIKDVRKQWIPLRLVTSLSRELESYQNETNKVLLSTFNERIAKEILLQPSPYIYERLGENYRHYFLDEFQDTSSLQWRNLIPLIETALISLNKDNRSGSLLLVGDPKQSIYRWRGGDVNQFIDLIEQGSPFQIKKKVNHLATNYRSAQSIVTFNNAFYQCLTQHLEYPENKILFGERAQQAVFSNQEGYVKLTFFREENDFEENPYTKRIVKDIEQCKQQGYSFLDMVVLVRKKKQADLIAKGLSDAGIPTITSTSLRLEENTQVKFLASLLQLYFSPNDQAIKKDHLSFLYPSKERKEDLHQFLLNNIPRDIEQVWKAEEISFDLSFFDHRAVMTVFEKACFLFPGIEMANPFIRAFLDLVFDFSQNEQTDTFSFLLFWEKKRATQSLTIPENSLGVKILTIHQAKGLEFPIVFFPYSDSLIHSNHQEKVWLSPQSLLGDKFPLAWVGYSKRLLNYGEEGEKAYHKKRQEDEMDAWNVFYVATTRASKQLYLYASDKNKEKESYVNVLMDLLPNAKIQEESQLIYEWGNRLVQSIKGKKTLNNQEEFLLSSTAYPYEQKLVLQMSRTEELESARLLGLRIHDLLRKINYQEEIQSVLTEAYLKGEITHEEQVKLQSLFNELMQSKVLSHFFTRAYNVLNEKAILIPQKGVLRPDRVGIGDNNVYVIDYKTGKEKPEHTLQVKSYATWIEKITHKKVNKFLVYLDVRAKKSFKILQLP